MPPLNRTRLFVLAVLAAAPIVGCRVKPFTPRDFTSHESLFVASKKRLDAKKWDDAIAGFEQLTLDLPARDTLLPLAHYYLGLAHEKKGEHILAAQSFTRLMESFPEDTLSDDALLAAGSAYRKLWRKSYLDSQYGEAALNTYSTLLALYPNSPLRAAAQRNVDQLTDQFAKKDYDAGLHYFRRKAYDSAILYFKDVVRKFPQSDYARRSQLRMVQSFDAIRYREDKEEICATLRERYPSDSEVRDRCGKAPQPPPATPAAAPTP